MVGQKIYVGVKILSNAKAEILSKNAQKRARQKTLNYAVGPKMRYFFRQRWGANIAKISNIKAEMRPKY